MSLEVRLLVDNRRTVVRAPLIAPCRFEPFANYAGVERGRARHFLVAHCLPGDDGGIIYHLEDAAVEQNSDGTFYTPLASQGRTIGSIAANGTFTAPFRAERGTPGILVIRHSETHLQ